MRHLRCAIPLTLVAALAIPGAALATAPPAILTAGVDEQDQLYATWSLAPQTAFRHVEFATLPIPDPELPDYFADGQFAGYDSCRTSSCANRTSYTADYPITRDRRYFVKVTATGGEEPDMTSPLWVIDATKPLVPGDADVGDGEGRAPVAGTPFDPTSLLGPGVVPRASITLLDAPKTIGGLLKQGVRVRVTSTVAHVVQTSMHSGTGRTVAERSVGFATGGTRTVATKVERASRAALRRGTRVRIRLNVVAVLPDGTRTKAARSFTVRR